MGLKNAGAVATIIGAMINFALFLTKLFVGISANSLAIYCDAINNLGDTLSCLVAFGGFLLAAKMSEIKSLRTQSLCTFVISLVIGISGAYFVYNGIERLMYPLPVSYLKKYAIIISATIFVKILMGIMFKLFNKKANSPVLRALVLDSFLDCFITLFALMGLVLVEKINFAVDGLFAIITGAIITISAVKTVFEQSKFLINN